MLAVAVPGAQRVLVRQVRRQRPLSRVTGGLVGYLPPGQCDYCAAGCELGLASSRRFTTVVEPAGGGGRCQMRTLKRLALRAKPNSRYTGGVVYLLAPMFEKSRPRYVFSHEHIQNWICLGRATLIGEPVQRYWWRISRVVPMIVMYGVWGGLECCAPLVRWPLQTLLFRVVRAPYCIPVRVPCSPVSGSCRGGYTLFEVLQTLKYRTCTTKKAKCAS